MTKTSKVLALAFVVAVSSAAAAVVEQQQQEEQQQPNAVGDRKLSFFSLPHRDHADDEGGSGAEFNSAGEIPSYLADKFRKAGYTASKASKATKASKACAMAAMSMQTEDPERALLEAHDSASSTHGAGIRGASNTRRLKKEGAGPMEKKGKEGMMGMRFKDCEE